MSVIHFSPEELAEVAAYAVGNTASRDGKDRLQRYAAALAEYSRENAAAYKATYDQEADAWTAEEILNRVRIVSDIRQIKRIISTLGLLRYNLVSNDGRDFATKETLSALLSMTLAIMRKTAMAALQAA